MVNDATIVLGGVTLFALGLAFVFYNFFEKCRTLYAPVRQVLQRTRALELTPAFLSNSLELIRTLEQVEGLQGTISQACSVLDGEIERQQFELSLQQRFGSSGLAAVRIEQIEAVTTRAWHAIEERLEFERTFDAMWVAGQRSAMGFIVASIASILLTVVTAVPINGAQPTVSDGNITAEAPTGLGVSGFPSLASLALLIIVAGGFVAGVHQVLVGLSRRGRLATLASDAGLEIPEAPIDVNPLSRLLTRGG